MAHASGAKGNPASHRMSNSHHKAKFEAAWKKSQEAKKKRMLAQTEREKANAKIRKEGGLTAWEKAKHERAQRRAAHPPVQQPRVDRSGNIIRPDGRVVPCCQAKSRVTPTRVKCPHLGGAWLSFVTSREGRDANRGRRI